MEFELILTVCTISFVCIHDIEGIDVDYVAAEPNGNEALDIFSRLQRNTPILHENANEVFLSGSKEDVDDVLSLRSASAIGCTSEIEALHCTLRCGKNKALCSSGACYCQYSQEQDKQIYFDRVNQYLSKRDYRMKHGLRTSDPETNDNVRPTLRHHVAHFCPNVELARSCIRKCMLQGKPAFCGKDLKCYCGHRYSPHDQDNKDDADNIYTEFKDLYEKYFGPGYQDIVGV